MPTRFRWSLVSDERLLDTRICDLPIKIKGSFIEPHIKRLYSELNDRGIRYKPHLWLSEWFNGGWRSCGGAYSVKVSLRRLLRSPTDGFGIKSHSLRIHRFP